MPRLIDADALMEYTQNQISRSIDCNDIARFPTIDAEPVVHGEWIYHECVSSYDGAISGYSCSNCCAFVDEQVFDMDESNKDFCGHCGAKMYRERKDNARNIDSDVEKSRVRF